MKKLFLPFVCFAWLCVGCGLLGGGGMTLKYNGTETSIEPRSAYVAPNSSGGHSIQITNYPVELDGDYDYSKIKAKEDGQYRLDVMILKQQSSGKQPIAVGEYKHQDSKEEPKDKIVRATIYRFENGKENPVEIDYKTLQGAVNITSVEGDTVKGSIDVTDGKSAIQGSFMAKMLK